ncbi:unnamed protein product [Orchesella dallaii]|uniref:Uncharacterized protein n=1 Tax=Orchesella dallaii TaxID=48710 RepID=A0ABP1S5Z3_9HEXA
MVLKGTHKTNLVVLVVLAITGWNNFTTASNPKTPGIDEMVKEQIVPDVIDAAPKAVLDVKYETVEVKLGNVLTPTQVKNPPNITWNADSNKLYLLYMADPDGPTRKDPIFREFIHWLVGNIPGTEISKGKIVAEFLASGPPKGAGLHRYTFLMYEQPNKLKFEEKLMSNRSVEGRGNFIIRNFAKKYNLGEPIAGNFFQAEWDDYVPTIHKYLNITM